MKAFNAPIGSVWEAQMHPLMLLLDYHEREYYPSALKRTVLQRRKYLNLQTGEIEGFLEDSWINKNATMLFGDAT